MKTVAILFTAALFSTSVALADANKQVNMNSQTAVSSNVQKGSGNVNLTKIGQYSEQDNKGKNEGDCGKGCGGHDMNKQKNASAQIAGAANYQKGHGNYNTTKIKQLSDQDNKGLNLDGSKDLNKQMNGSEQAALDDNVQKGKYNLNKTKIKQDSDQFNKGKNIH